MIGTHADSLIASAVTRNVTGFDLDLAYEAVRKNADVPPVNDPTTQSVRLLPLAFPDLPISDHETDAYLSL